MGAFGANRASWNVFRGGVVGEPLRFIDFLRQYPEKIDWDNLSRNSNPQVIELLKDNPKKINWCSLSENPNAIDLLIQRLKQNYPTTSIDYGRKDKINLKLLCDNINVSRILHQFPKYVNYSNYIGLSSNPSAIDFLKEHPNRICWDDLSSNPNAIDLLENNIDKINWNSLSSNPNAMHLLHLFSI